MRIFQEELLEPLARYFRYRKGAGEINKRNVVVLDLGCGPNISYYKFIKNRKLKIKQYIGIDPLLNKETQKKFLKNKEVTLIKSVVSPKFLKKNSVDYIVGFAFLEHVEKPKKVITEILEILKIDGKAIFTCPSPKAIRILEFLSFKLGLISKSLMFEHKNYFDKKKINDLLKNFSGRIEFRHEYFEFGLNNLIVITKNK